MKRIMLIIISVIVLFAACGNQADNSVEESTPTQIDPAKEFDGILFGMTKYDVVSLLGKKPDCIHERYNERSDSYMEYRDEEHFNVGNADVTYSYEYGQLIEIDYHYNYDDPEQEQFISALAAIKEEILRRYPEEIHTDDHSDETDDGSITYIFYTENRCIYLHTYADLLIIYLSISEYDPAEDKWAEPEEELDSITFNMTKNQIIEFYGRQPDKTSDRDNFSSIDYENETCFNISNANVSYEFYKNQFQSIHIAYYYSKDSDENSFRSDYNSIRKKLMERYFASVNSLEETDNTLRLSLDDRDIFLSRHDTPWNYSIGVSIDN